MKNPKLTAQNKAIGRVEELAYDEKAEGKDWDTYLEEINKEYLDMQT